MSSHIPAPSPKPLELLTRPQVAARVGAPGWPSICWPTNRPATAPGYPCVGAMKRNLIELEECLRANDHAAPAPARLAGTPWQPSERQVADFRALADSTFPGSQRAGATSPAL